MITLNEEEVYTCTGESYEEKHSIDITEGRRTIKMLHRVEGDAWVLEKMTLADGEVVFEECERITDEEAKQFLIELGEAEALVKHGFKKPHGADTETEEETHEDEETADGKQMQRVPVKWVRKLSQVRDELVKLAARKHNDPEQRSILEDCIKEISAIEKLLECDKLNPWWRPAITKALQHIQRILLKFADRLALDKLNALIEWMKSGPQA